MRRAQSLAMSVSIKKHGRDSCPSLPSPDETTKRRCLDEDDAHVAKAALEVLNAAQFKSDDSVRSQTDNAADAVDSESEEARSLMAYQVRSAIITQLDLGSSPAPSGSSINLKPKLNHSDLCLMLYLIIQVKPFKYVGDRSIPQTRKWVMIQEQFATHALREGPVVPTVRTLQRHLASAIRACQARLAQGETPPAVFALDHTTTNVFDSPTETDMDYVTRVSSYVTPTTELSDLEWAIYSLSELSGMLRVGDGSSLSGTPRGGSPYPGTRDTVPLPRAGLRDLVRDQSASIRRPESSARAAKALDQFEKCICSLRSSIDSQDERGLMTRPILDGISRGMAQLHQRVAEANDRVLHQTYMMTLGVREDTQRIVDANYENLQAQTALIQGLILLLNRK